MEIDGICTYLCKRMDKNRIKIISRYHFHHKCAKLSCATGEHSDQLNVIETHKHEECIELASGVYMELL